MDDESDAFDFGPQPLPSEEPKIVLGARRRSGPGSLWPWALMTLMAAAAAAAMVTVFLPLRQQLLQCHEQLHEALTAAEQQAAASEVSQQELFADARANDGQKLRMQRQQDALMQRLTTDLDRNLSLGQVALAAFEQGVTVRLASDFANGRTAQQTFRTVVNALAQEDLRARLLLRQQLPRPCLIDTQKRPGRSGTARSCSMAQAQFMALMGALDDACRGTSVTWLAGQALGPKSDVTLQADLSTDAPQ